MFMESVSVTLQPGILWNNYSNNSESGLRVSFVVDDAEFSRWIVVSITSVNNTGVVTFLNAESAVSSRKAKSN